MRPLADGCRRPFRRTTINNILNLVNLVRALGVGGLVGALAHVATAADAVDGILQKTPELADLKAALDDLRRAVRSR